MSCVVGRNVGHRKPICVFVRAVIHTVRFAKNCAIEKKNYDFIPYYSLLSFMKSKVPNLSLLTDHTCTMLYTHCTVAAACKVHG